MRGSVLTVSLEAKEAQWHINGPTRPPMTIEAFAERGKAPLMPGPLVRVPRGMELRLSIRNSLAKPLTFFVPAAIHGGPDRLDAMDSIIVAPRTVETLTTHASAPGSFVYRATTPDRAVLVNHSSGLLAGAIVVDTVGAAVPSHDRVFVIMATEDSASIACDDTTSSSPIDECHGRRFVYTINGQLWPSTERIRATVGDSLRWRVINASFQIHPMHLHGFYYRVDAFSGPFTSMRGRPAPGQKVVTQLLEPLSAMSMTWSPDRPGNWLFHCHFATHNTPDSLRSAPGDRDEREMIGMVLGTIVAPRPGAVATRDPAPARRLRLIAERAAPVAAAPSTTVAARRAFGKLGSVPPMHFVLEENGQDVIARGGISPEMDLVRGEPVAITIVNHLAEPTSVHWHGIEVEDSYMDGVPGFSGSGTHLTPAIAPGDSFVARFTPPRAGSFMYHAHVDEMRQQAAGLEGALVVREPGAPHSPDDHVAFLTGHLGDGEHPLEIDGGSDPDTVVLHAGRTARWRLFNLATAVPTGAPTFSLTARADSAGNLVADTLLVPWRPIAKDGFDLPTLARTPCPARQIVSVGETYDFEYTPERRGALRLEVRTTGAPHRLLIRIPVRVE
jgi:manganese oxidase